MRTTFLALVLTCGVAVSLAADGPPQATPEAALSRLLKADSAEARQRAMEALVALPPDQVLPLLREALFADPTQALTDLGADDFRTRQRATELLCNQGPAVRAPLEALRQKTTDPEIRTRCQEILARIKDTPEGGAKSARHDAVRVALLAGAAGDALRPFVAELSSQLQALPREQRRSHLNAREPLATSPSLADLLLLQASRATTLADLDKLAGALAELQPLPGAGVVTLLDAVERLAPTHSELRVQLYGQASALAWLAPRLNRLGRGELPPWLKEFAALPAYTPEQQRLAMACLTSANPVAQTLGLAIRTPEPTAPVAAVLALVRPPADLFAATPDAATRRRELNAKLQALAPELLAAAANGVADLGAQLFLAQANPPLEPLLDYLLQRATLPGIRQIGPAFKFIFTDRMQAVQAAVTAEVGKCGPLQVRRLEFLMRLSELLGVLPEPGAYDSLWIALAKTCTDQELDAPRGMLGELGVGFNVSGKALRPLLTGKTPFSAALLDRLLQGDAEDQQSALDLCRRQPDADAPVPYHRLRFGPVLQRHPELFPQVAKAVFASLTAETEPAFGSHQLAGDGDDAVAALGLCLRAQPQHAALISGYLVSPEFGIRLAACRALVLSWQAKPELEPQLLRLLQEAPNASVRTGVIGLMLQAGFAAKAELWQAFDEVLADPTVPDRNIGYIMDCIDDRTTAAVPFLKRALQQIPVAQKTERALHVAAAILCPAPGDAEARQSVLAIVNGPDIHYANWALRALSWLDAPPALSPERLAVLYRDAMRPAGWTEALQVSPVNAKAAGPILLANLDLHSWRAADLGALLHKTPDLQLGIGPEMLRCTRDSDPEWRAIACDLLVKCPQAFAAKPELLLARLKDESSAGVLYALLQTIANLGPPAAVCAPEIEKRLAAAQGNLRRGCLFALASITADPGRRRQHLTALLADYDQANTADRHMLLNMAGMVSGCDDLTAPLLQRAARQPWDHLRVRETPCLLAALGGLARRPPLAADGVAAFRTALENALFDCTTGGAPSHSMNVLLGLRQDPQACLALLPLLDKMPANCPVPGEILTVIRRAAQRVTEPTTPAKP